MTLRLDTSVTTGTSFNAKTFGCIGDGAADDTAAAIVAMAAAGGGELYFPAGTYLMTRLTVPSNVTVRGAGRGVTIFKLKNGANQDLLRNSGYGAAGNTAIQLLDFTIDANGANQTSFAHAVAIDLVTNSVFGIECKNARGAGFAFTNSNGNTFLPSMYCRDNGLAVAGYGLYLANSSNNYIDAGRYDNNCIGIAVESSGSGNCDNNRIVGPSCLSNRADFGQSGAGLHFEQVPGSSCTGNSAIGATCSLSTGGGIVDSGTVLTRIIGCNAVSNYGPGISAVATTDFVYADNTLKNNSLVGSSAPYRDEMRFDDSGSAGSVGLVIGNVLTGTAPDGGIRCMSANSAVVFIANKLSGYSTNYTINGTLSSVIQNLQGTYTGTLTGCTTSPTGTVSYELNGRYVHLTVVSTLATSNGPTCTYTGMPAAIRPSAQRSCIGLAADNGNNVISWFDIETSGAITLRNGVSGTFTSSGTKGIQPCTLVYPI